MQDPGDIVPQVETGQRQLVMRLDISNNAPVVAAVEHGGFRVLSSTVGESGTTRESVARKDD